MITETSWSKGKVYSSAIKPPVKKKMGCFSKRFSVKTKALLTMMGITNFMLSSIFLTEIVTWFSVKT